MPRSECRKAGGAGGGPRALVQPRDTPIYINRSGRCPRLEVRLVQATVARASHTKGPYPLGQCAFAPRSALLGLLALVTGIPGSGRLE
jgi:hypothetical protein